MNKLMYQTTEAGNLIEDQLESTQNKILGNPNSLAEILRYLQSSETTNLISTSKNINRNKKDKNVIDILDREYLIQKYGRITTESWYEAISYGNVDDYDLFTKFIDTTEIGMEAFKGNQLTQVTIPNSVKTIGVSAFKGNQLTQVTIPDSVITIGIGAFCWNNGLKEVTIGNYVETIGEGSFYGIGLTRLILGNSVKTIGDRAFWNGQFKTDIIVTIPNSLTNLANNAFDNIFDDVRRLEIIIH